ncbi:MAG: hypothetical protein CSA42_08215 [Gammaproteobacteria bacterium]|nr:MAG: hypothetical protein CSA42_08215 [Gammaproteobacteria bacterium]
MIDGIDVELLGQMTIGCPNKDSLNQIFMSQNVYGKRLDLVHKVCEKHINEVHHQNELLNRHRLSPAGWTLEYRPLSQDNFYAHASKIDHGENNYEISFSLGIPAILLSIAIELNSNEQISAYKNNNRNSINDWFFNVDDETDIPDETINWVLDTCLLLYFHEVCHVIFGHCKYQENNNNETRALEMDADFNAGSMFGLFLKEFLDPERKFISGVNTLTRVIKAGFLAGVALKALSGKSEKYHYPTIRIMSFYAGCIFPLTNLGDLENFKNINEGDDYYNHFVTSVREPLLESLRNSSLRYYAGTEQEIESDYEELINVTSPLRNKLKDGPLKNLAIPVIRA